MRNTIVFYSGISLLIITFLVYLSYNQAEHYKAENFSNNEKSECQTDIPLVTLGCNNVPNFPDGIEPKKNIVTVENFPVDPSERLADEKGKYTFRIPELKYDGIYSRKLDKNNKCCWSLNKSNEPLTYGTNSFFHVPEKSMFGKTVIEPPECQGYSSSGYSPEYYIAKCEENNVPCSVLYKK